jgi:hypothetical protein
MGSPSLILIVPCEYSLGGEGLVRRFFDAVQ